MVMRFRMQESEITMIGQYKQASDGLQPQLRWIGPIVAVLLIVGLAACSCV
jgi:hypothetical protein